MPDIESVNNTDSQVAGFSSALASAESSLNSDPSAPESSSPETTLPAGSPESSPPVAPSLPRGPVSFERFEEVNGRMKAAETFQRQYQWAERYTDPHVVDAAMRREQARSADLATYLENELADGLMNPLARPQVMALLGKALGALRGGSPAPQMPQPDYIDPATGTKFYSAQALEQFGQYLKTSILQEVNPLNQRLSSIESAAQAQQAEVQLSQWTADTLSTVRALPYFSEHEAEIKRVYADMQLPDDHPATAALFLRHAYQQVVLPKIEALSEQKVRTQYQRDAQASTLNPAAAGAPASGKRPRDFKEALAQAEAQLAGR